MTEGVHSFDPAALLRLRRARGLSLDALGERVGRARPNLIAWEKGPARPSPAKLVVLARALGVEPWELTTAKPADATLADLRGWAGLTQPELAERAEIARSTYSLVERGGLALRPDVAERIAAALDVEAEEVERAHARSRPQERAEEDVARRPSAHRRAGAKP